ncbi:MAG: hypothetical protein COB33_009435 [Thiotrichaceae bacterium]|nr:hypothetical protein [Thiotrichaceae bacterium]
MNLNFKVLAVVVIVMGLMVVGGYQLGTQQASHEVAKEKGQPAARLDVSSMVAGELKAGAQVPLNHPPMDSPRPMAQSNTFPQPSTPQVDLAGRGGSVETPATQLTGESRFAHFRVGNRNVKGLAIDGDYVWIGTSGGVIRYHTIDDQYDVFDNRIKGMLSNGVFHVSRIDNKLLVGTYGGGLSVMDIDTSVWTNYNIPNGLADQFVYDVQKTSNGDIWIATWSGANRIRGGDLDDHSKWDMFTVENTNGGIPNPWVYGVEEGLNGDIWLATEEGLALYRGGKWQNWQHKDGLGAPLDVVRDAITSRNDPAKASQHHARQKTEQGLEDVDIAYNPNYIISLAVDSDGIVWAGTWGGGLARFDGENWTNYTTADGLPGNHIFMLHIDIDGQLWIGTSKGLARFKEEGEGFNVMTTLDGLYANNVFSLAKSGNGTMWVGSFGGVAKLSGQL